MVDSPGLLPSIQRFHRECPCSLCLRLEAEASPPRCVWYVQEKHEAVNEVMLLASINCPYVVKYYDSFMENDELHIVMEYCNRCDIHLLTWSQGGWERTMRP